MRIVSKTFRSTAFRWVGVVGLMLASGCSGSGTASPTTAAEVNAGPTTEAQEVAATTTEVVEREQVTLPDEFSSPQDEIIATYLLYNELYLIAAGEPEADPGYEPLYEVLAGPHEEYIRDTLTELQEAGHVHLEPSDAGSHTVRFGRTGGPIEEGEEEDREVILLDCFYNVTEIRDLDGNTIDDEYETLAIAAVMKVIDGKWRVFGIDVKQVFEGEAECSSGDWS